MSQLVFDTLEFVKTLEDAGIPKAQAEAIARAHKKAFAEMVDASQLATRGDIARLEKQISDLETRLVKMFFTGLFGMGGLIVAAIGVAVAILK